jgi:hypothetical protein
MFWGVALLLGFSELLCCIIRESVDVLHVFVGSVEVLLRRVLLMRMG